MEALATPNIFKISLALEESQGMFFVTSAPRPDIFVAITSHEHLRPAVETCLKKSFANEGRRVNVYMNGKLGGPVLDAVIEVL